MQTLNKITLIGALGQNELDIHTFENGGQQAKISLATNNGFWSKEKDMYIERDPDWHQLVIKTPHLIKKLDGDVKGVYLHVEGKQHNRKYEKDGETRYVSEVHVESIIILKRPESKN